MSCLLASVGLPVLCLQDVRRQGWATDGGPAGPLPGTDCDWTPIDRSDGESPGPWDRRAGDPLFIFELAGPASLQAPDATPRRPRSLLSPVHISPPSFLSRACPSCPSLPSLAIPHALSHPSSHPSAMMFPKAFVVASLALSALATPHMARHVDHRAVAHRAAMPDAAPEPVVVPAKKKRADSSRCKVRSSSSAPAATSSSIVPVKNVQSAAPTSSEAPPTSSEAPTTKAAEPTTKAAEPTTTPSSTKEKPTSTKEPATTEKPTTSSKAAEPTSSPSSGSANDPLGILTGQHVGQGEPWSIECIYCPSV